MTSLHRRSRKTLTKGVGGQVDGRPLLRFTHDSRDFAGHIDSCLLTEAEFFDVSKIAVPFKLLSYFGEADVARDLKNLGERQPTVRMGVVNDFSGIRVFAHFAIEEIVFADDPFFERRRGQESF